MCPTVPLQHLQVDVTFSVGLKTCGGGVYVFQTIRLTLAEQVQFSFGFMFANQVAKLLALHFAVTAQNVAFLTLISTS